MTDLSAPDPATADRALLQGAPCGLMAVDADLGVLAINDTLLGWLGQDRSALGGTGVVERPHLPTLAGVQDAETTARLVEHWRLLQQTHSAPPLEVRLAGPDGQAFTAQLTSSAVCDAQGRFLHSHTLVLDITERHKQAHRQASRLDFLQAITDRSPSRLAYYDKDLICGFCNLVYAEDHGMTPEQMVGMHLSDALAPDMVSHLLPRVSKVLGGEAQEHEIELGQPDGERRYYSVRYQPDQRTGQVEGFFIELIDITERRRTEDFVFNANLELEERVAQRSAELYASEQRWRQMSDAIRDHSMFFIDIAGGITDWTESAQRLHGFERAAILGQPMDTLFQATEGESELLDAQALVALCLDTGHAEQAMWGLRRDGSRFWSSVTLTALRNEQDELQGLSVITRDLTEAKKLADLMAELNRDLEQRVSERTDQLAAANKDLDAFSYLVSHDLRAPLRHISQFVALAQEELADEGDSPLRQHLVAIANAGRRMSQMIEGLIEYSRLGRLQIEPQPVALAPLVQGVVERLRALHPERSIDWSIDPQLPLVPGDAMLLSEAFEKLLDNAIKFTRRSEHARVEVGLLPLDGASQTVYVRDNGAGFDLEKAKSLFVMFQRQHHSMDFEGMGMGLALTQRIVERHQGRIWCETAPEQGCTFFIELPQLDADIALG